MIRGLWYQRDESIIDVKNGDANADSYKYYQMADLMAWWETIQKYKHGKHYHNLRKNNSLFVLFVSGMLVREALVVLAQLIRTMASKMD